MVVNNLQRIKDIISSMVEGSFFGFLLAVFLWGFLYLMYILEGYGKTSTELNIHRVPYSIDLFNLCIILIFTGSVIKIMQKIYDKCIKDSIINWLKTGIITFVFFYLIVLIWELYLLWIFDSDCCYEFVNFPLWLLIFVLILIFSAFYAIIKKFVVKFIQVDTP